MVNYPSLRIDIGMTEVYMVVADAVTGLGRESDRNPLNGALIELMTGVVERIGITPTDLDVSQ
jgi:hypothetical protein